MQTLPKFEALDLDIMLIYLQQLGVHFSEFQVR